MKEVACKLIHPTACKKVTVSEGDRTLTCHIHRNIPKQSIIWTEININSNMFYTNNN